MNILNNKTIVIGVTGGIAVYKTVDLASKLCKKGANVDIIMTEAAQKFVTPLTFSTITRRDVYTDMFKEYITKPGHISLADKADLFVVAPATANTIAKINNGIADNLLTTTLLATQAPVLLAPAMNNNMYTNPVTQENLARLKKRGAMTIGPEEGMLACGTNAIGRMSEPSQIIDKIEEILLQTK